MPLFTDGDISNISDLRSYDSSILDVATTEGVDLSAKLSLAEAEITLELEAFLGKHQQADAGLSVPAVDVSHVVLTPPLKRWHTVHTLAVFYRDVYSSQVNDRYGGKWKQYRQLSQEAASMLFRLGVGLVSWPVARAEPPAMAMVPGGVEPGMYYVQVAWRNQSGGLGAPSTPLTYLIETAGLLKVTAVHPPVNAVGSDIYVGRSEEEISRQNTLPVDAGQAWTMPGTGLVSGDRPGSGQTAEWFLRANRVLQRG